MNSEHRVSERQIVDVNSDAILKVRLDQRAAVKRNQDLFTVLLGELEVTSNPEGQGLIDQLMLTTSEPDEDETEEVRKRR